MKIKDFVDIKNNQNGLIFDLRYAGKNNVLGCQLYSHPFCYLHKDAAEKIFLANRIVNRIGLKIKIFDAYRPLEVQEFMFSKICANGKNEGFVSNPDGGVIPHCRGVAVDLTLTDANENELDMGSDFDEFSELAWHQCEAISNSAKKNRLLLLGIMTEVGFDFYSKEWWHYQLFNPRNYPIIKTDPTMIMLGKL
jgi:D-alanyl-D-alanine dipeptidase